MCESSTHILSHGLISSKAVVTASQDRTVPVKILNPGSNSVVIPKGKIIAKFSQLTEEYQVRHVNCKNNVPVVQNINLVKQCSAEQGDRINCEFLENFEINPNLKDDQKIALNHLLCDNKEVFVTTDSPNLGCTDIAQHHIILKPDMRPLHQKPYRLTPHKKEVLRHHLDELLQQGVICELNATEEVPITSPVVLVAKRSKPSSEQISEKTTSLRQFRFCVDFRYLNTQQEPLKSFIPDIQELTESFTERIPNYIASIDLRHHISKEGIRPPPDRVRALNEFPPPQNVKQLRRALGMFNWFRKFFSNYSSAAEPLTRLLKKSAKFVWSQEQKTSFTRIKHLLLTSAVLAFPRFDLQFFLAVDSSATGIGYMLYQKHPSDTGEQIRVVRFGSKSLNSWQKSYGPTKLELLVVTSIVDCASYLRGDRFTVECDHQALRSLFQNQFKGAIYDRWLAVLQQFNFDIKYKPAADMQVPDALSRVENAPLLDVNAEESLNENDPHFPYEVEEVGKISFVNFAKLSTDEIETGYTADTEEESSKLTYKQESIDGHSSLPCNSRHPTDLFDVCGNECVSDCACDTLFVNKYENETNNLRIDDLTPILQRHPIDFIDSCGPECDQTGDSLYLHVHNSGFGTEFTTVQDMKFVGTADKTRDQPTDFNRENIKHLQRLDETLIPVILYLENGTLPKLQKEARRLLLKAPDYSMIDDLLFHSRVAKSKRTQRMGEFQLVIPKQLISKVLETYHQTPLAGHMGIQQTVDNISEQFYFQNLPSTVSSYVRSCHDCPERKMTKAHTKSEIISFRTPTEPFKLGSSDSVTVSHALFQLVCTFGVCDCVISDKGSEFISQCTDQLCKILEVNQNFTQSFIHHCLGLCERTHRTVAERLTPYTKKGIQWDNMLPAITFSFNISPSDSTKYSPYEVVYGFRPKFPLSVSKLGIDLNSLHSDYHSYINQQIDKLKLIREEAVVNAQKASEIMKERENKKTNPLKLNIGDFVYMLKEVVGPGKSFNQNTRDHMLFMKFYRHI
ncbi:unnamed protein product [Mytilus edulis]|uniref:Integrase catalytic domain-containing protein n=1 Tax=Mytilus edulis TaxID=6550 RepID=A0A8S3SIE4_MYTED|nr:unnamed protein product [Mytilus edulis]